MPAYIYANVEVTDPAEPRAFPKRPTKDQAGSEDNPLDDQDTIYGLAAWTDRDSGLTWVAGLTFGYLSESFGKRMTRAA